MSGSAMALAAFYKEIGWRHKAIWPTLDAAQGKRMKKYFSVLVPLVFCTGLAIFFSVSDPNPEAIYGDQATYDWLSNVWFYIGVITGGLTLITLLIEDVFSLWNQGREECKLRRGKP